MVKGEINTSFETLQKDIWASGIAAHIGMNAFGTWLALKAHADYNTGECWPGVRRLGTLTGLSLGAVQKSVKILVDAKLLRVLSEGKGTRSTRYVACERLDVKFGDRLLATIVIDYVPAKLKDQLEDLSSAFKSGKNNQEAFARCEIIPAEGFVWDAERGVLAANIPHSELPDSVFGGSNAEDEFATAIGQRVRLLQDQSKKRGK